MLLQDKDILEQIIGLTTHADNIFLKVTPKNMYSTELEVRTGETYHTLQVPNTLSKTVDIIVNGELYTVHENPRGNVKSVLKVLLSKIAHEVSYKHVLKGYPAHIDVSNKTKNLLKLLRNNNSGYALAIRKANSLFVIEMNGLLFTCDTEAELFSYTTYQGLPTTQLIKHLRDYLNQGVVTR